MGNNGVMDKDGPMGNNERAVGDSYVIREPVRAADCPLVIVHWPVTVHHPVIVHHKTRAYGVGLP